MPGDRSAELLERTTKSASSVNEATNSAERKIMRHLDRSTVGLLCTEGRNYATCAARRSESGEEKAFRLGTPSMDGVRFYQAWSVTLGSVTHLKGIAICEIRRYIAGVSDRNIWAFFSQMDMIAVVVEAMRK